MASWVCAVERSARGGVIERVRLIGPADRDAVWVRGSEEPDEAPRAAAAWVRERVRKGRVRVVLDADGAVCSWLTVPGEEPAVLEAMVRQAASAAGDGTEAAAPGVLAASVLGPDAAIPGGATVQALPQTPGDGQEDDDGRRRRAVVAVPDACVRLMLDAMDGMGVDIVGIWSLWDVLATAWDPAARDAGGVGVVSAGAAAVIVVEPTGRLTWAWSGAGDVLAAGAMRVGRRTHGEAVAAVVRESDVGRLIGEWLGWGAQIGSVPTRVALLMPDVDEGVDRDGEDGSGEASRGLSAGAIGRRLASAWDGVGTDVLTDADPMGRTLRAWRELEDDDDRAGTLRALSERPGRGHRGMYRWTAAAVLAMAGVIGVAAWRTWSDARETRAEVDALRQERIALIEAVDPRMARQPNPVGQLQSALNERRRASQAPPEVLPLWPVLNELESVTLVLMGVPLELQAIELNQFNATLTGVVPDTETYEALSESLRAISGFIEEWSGTAETVRGRDGGLDVSFTGRWPIEVPSFAQAGPGGGDG